MSLAWKKLTLDIKVKETFFCCSPVFHWILCLDLQLSLLFQDIVLYALYMYSTWPNSYKGSQPIMQSLPGEEIAYRHYMVNVFTKDSLQMLGCTYSTW